MADQPIAPQFTDEPYAPLTGAAPTIIKSAAVGARPVSVPVVERRRSVLSALDLPLLLMVMMLLAIGAMMVYSTTFFWSYETTGSESTIFLQHARNMGIGFAMLLVTYLVDYRIWRRLAPLLLLFTIASLIAVLVFGDNVFNARRAFIQGSYQPGELAELMIVIFMAAWLGSKRARVASFWRGLVPFSFIISVIGALVIAQPDISTAATIFVTAGLMFFLAGANIWHLGGILGTMGITGFILSQQLDYAQGRVSSFFSGLTDLTTTNYHAQQAIIAFLNGGWTGVGLGQGRQKYGFLPAPHTDSIFAVIGEELGVVGAIFVVLLYIVLVVRGLQIARRARDPFGALLASGLTLWIVTKALINIAVMLNLLPSTGIALPFVSFGGSSLVTVMMGAGLLLSIARVTVQNPPPGVKPERQNDAQADHRGGRDGRSRLSGARGR
ncbi:MAG: putative peptidoglycan glycosyltransferase FtsW [Chloroflexota bacterium]|nr:putative peptidoglycan glycosyltransferase FtsW [Chloroflexota bacterium]